MLIRSMVVLWALLLVIVPVAAGQTTLTVNDTSTTGYITDFVVNSTNYKVRIDTSGNIIVTGNVQAGNGTALAPSLSFANLTSGGLYTDGISKTLFGNTNVGFGTDNTYNIGSSGANRPASIYAGTSISSPNHTAPAGLVIQPGTDSTTAVQIENSSGTQTIAAVDTVDNQIRLTNGSASFPSLSFTGLTSGGLYTDGTNTLFGNTNVGFGTDNAYNIGATTGNRPQSIYLGTGVIGFKNPSGSSTDTGLSRLSTNVVAVGNGTSGDTSGTIRAAGFAPTANVLISGTAPTVTAGNCGGGTITVAANGTAAFTVTVGTGGSNTCTINLPTAANGWNCFAFDTTSPTGGGGFYVKQTGGTASTAILKGYSTTAALTPIAAGDALSVSCFAR